MGAEASIGWTPITDTRVLDARRALPVKVLLACWYDAPSHHDGAYAYVFEAGYFGAGRFGHYDGTPLGNNVMPTHWDYLPAPPPEDEMLGVALSRETRALWSRGLG